MIRVYLFPAEQGRQRKLRFDPELLYVAAAYHDLGLIKKFSSPDERFEVDGANAARQFLSAHNIAEDRVQTVWEAIALHTTPGIPKHMGPEVALLNSGVLLDVIGVGFDQFPVEVREEIVAKYPPTPRHSEAHGSRSRAPHSGVLLDVIGVEFDQFPVEVREEIVAKYPLTNFKERFVQEFFAGFAHKPATTYGTVNASVCERFLPGFKSPNACDLIVVSPFPDSSSQSSAP